MHWTLNLKENRQLFFTAKVRWFCLFFWIFSLTCAIPFVNVHGICFEFSSVHMISCCLISQDERLLIVLNNCRYVQNHVLPKLVQSFRINEYPISDKLKKVLCMKTLMRVENKGLLRKWWPCWLKYTNKQLKNGVEYILYSIEECQLFAIWPWISYISTAKMIRIRVSF